MYLRWIANALSTFTFSLVATNWASFTRNSEIKTSEIMIPMKKMEVGKNTV